MYARLTRYEGAPPADVEQTLQAKRRVLPTEPGQTEGMKGAVFLVNREHGTVLVLSLWEDADALEASEPEAARLREEVIGEGETATAEHYEVALFAVEQARG
jgi:hypothetical protein